MKHKLIRIALASLEAFVALGAVAGGIGLLTGTIPASPGSLQGSMFVDYTVPALLLMVIVGGSMLLAAATILTGREIGVLASVFAGLTMMIFEIVEAAVVDRSGGSELVFTVVLQSFYFTFGLVIFGLAGYLWMIEYRGQHVPTKDARYAS